MSLKHLLLSGAWTVLWGVQLCKPQWILGQLSRNSLHIMSMLWNGKEVGFQVIKFSYRIMVQDLQDLFLYQKLQYALITKSFNTITVQEGWYRIDSIIAEKQAMQSFDRETWDAGNPESLHFPLEKNKKNLDCVNQCQPWGLRLVNIPLDLLYRSS